MPLRSSSLCNRVQFANMILLNIFISLQWGSATTVPSVTDVTLSHKNVFLGPGSGRLRV